MNEQGISMNKTGSGLSAGILKLIAIAAMLIDHIASVFVESSSPLGVLMHFVGRITGPIMFYFIVEGYHYTRDVNRYVLRLAIFAVVSYVPFIYCFYGHLPNARNFLSLNVMYTLCIGLLVLRAKYEIQNPLLRSGVILALFIISTVGDWFFMAPLIIWYFDAYRGDFRKQAKSYCIITAISLAMMMFTMQENYSSVISQAGMILPIILLYFYNGEKGRGSKCFFYIFYPVHLLILGLIHYFFVG